MKRFKSKLRTASKWTKVYWIWLLSGSASLLLAFVLAFAIFLYLSPEWEWADWTGFGKDSTVSKEETLQNGKLTVTKRITHFQSAKPLWDWLGLAGVIAIPIVIPVVLFLFQQQQAKVEKEIAATIFREEALQNYIDKIAELLIDKKLKLLLKQLSDESISKDDPELDAFLDIARARTLSILRRLDGDKERKSSVFLFLVEAELIKGLGLLKDVNLSGFNLIGVNFYKAYLSNVNFSGANLEAAFFNGADLWKANFSGANLYAASFNGADLKEADFSGANLQVASFSEANLNSANFDGADLNGADLNGADLKFAKSLTPKQIHTAINWKTAEYSSDLCKQLGLQPENAP